MSTTAHTFEGNKNLIPVPHSLEELWGYFKYKEEIDPGYAGYADVAANVADSIEMVRQSARTESGEALNLPIPIQPGRDSAIWLHEQTPATRELVELIFAVNNLEAVIDETTDDNPYGRILWQSIEPYGRFNLIEHRWKGNKGEALMLSAVSQIPETLVDASSKSVEYSEKDENAIKRAKAFQKAGSIAVARLRAGEVEQEELDYLLFISRLDTTSFESPGDQQLAA